MKNKKGQFYFLAVILLAAVFITLVTVSNKISYTPQSNAFYESHEINFEVSHLLDYAANENLSDSASRLKFENFSKSWVDEFGSDKNVFFIFGNSTNITLLGNKVSGTSLLVNTGSGNQTISNSGFFENNYTLSGNNAKLYLDNQNYNFTFYSGQDIYYLIKYIYNNQTFVING